MTALTEGPRPQASRRRLVYVAVAFVIIVVATIVGLKIKQGHDERVARKEALRRQYDDIRAFAASMRKFADSANKADSALRKGYNAALRAGQQRHDNPGASEQADYDLVTLEISNVDKMRDAADTAESDLRDLFDLVDSKYGSSTTKAARRDLDDYTLARLDSIRSWTEAATQIQDSIRASLNGRYYVAEDVRQNYDASSAADDRARVKRQAVLQDVRGLFDRVAADQSRIKHEYDAATI